MISVPQEFLRNGNLDKGPRIKPLLPTLDKKALHGLAGEAVQLMLPHTEADEVALLMSFLAGVGNAMGRGAYIRVGADIHRPNLFVALVGETSKGRKGMSWNMVRETLHKAAPAWADNRILGGLSSGEGLIHAVRDRVESKDTEGKVIVVDSGELDKRLMVVEGEFAGPLNTMARDGNTLSVLIRQAWDGIKLATLTRNSPLKASDAHISIVGHITRTELIRQLSESDAHNGFANRFLWLWVKRSKALAFGGEWHTVDTGPLIEKVNAAIKHGQKELEVVWGDSARKLWSEVYEDLSEGKCGLFGAAISRAEAQTLRVAMLYAVLDHSQTIKRPHLEAALAVWRYAEESARYIFGDATGDPVADRIVSALGEEPDGLTRTELINLFNRHKSRDQITQSLELLKNLGRVRCERVSTGGRPADKWFLVQSIAKEAK